jgi:hypothetical protein
MKKMWMNLPTDDVRQLQFTHDQADGGANFAATNRLDLLHDCRVHKMALLIVSFFTQDNGSSRQEQHTATGEGTFKLAADSGEIIPMRMLRTPTSTGTVILPEHAMKDMAVLEGFNGRMKKEEQQACCRWKQGTNCITSQIRRSHPHPSPTHRQ